MAKTTEGYWEGVAKARDLDVLRESISRDREVARQAFTELSKLLTELEALSTSRAVDQLRWLGVEIAEVAGDVGGRATLMAERLQVAAMESLQLRNKTEAVSRLVEAASISLEAQRVEDTLRITRASVVLLFAFGEFDNGLRAAESLLVLLEGRSLETPDSRARLYDLASARRAPAGDRWASILAQIEATMRRAGDEALAAATASCLAAALIRSGALENGADLLADTEPVLLRVRVKSGSGELLPIPEASDAHLWRARALDLLGIEAEAESAYRSHPAFADPTAPDHDEVKSRLVELLMENDRLQEALDLMESGEPQVAEYRALWRALLAKVYALLNRPAASRSAAQEATSYIQEAEESGQGDSTFRRTAADRVRTMQKQMYEPSETRWRVQVSIAESAAVRREAGSTDLAVVSNALGWARRLGDRAMEARCLEAQGEIAFGSGDAEGAARLLAEALECELTPAGTRVWQRFRSATEQGLFPEEQRRAGYRRSRTGAGVGIRTRLLLGRAQAAAGKDPSEALDTAIGGARRRNRRLTLYAALAAKAAWLSSQEQAAKARTVWEDAAGVLESLRADLTTIESQIGLLEDKETVYGELLAAAVESSDGEMAVRLVERAKARAFLEQIRSGEPLAPISAEAESQARGLRQRLVRLMERQAAGEEDSAGSLELQQLKNRFVALYRGGRRRTQPAAGALGKDVALLSATGVAVVEYLVSAEHVFAIAAHHGRLAAPVLLPVRREDLEHLLQTLQFEIGVRERCRSLEALHAALFAPVEPFLRGASRLLMVPHGMLHGTPLHALRGPDGVYLAQRFTMQYAPSVAVAAEVARHPWTGTPGSALLIGASETPYSALPPLRFARAETEEIAKSVPGARIFCGMEAVRRHMVRGQTDVEILHCACHGEFDPDDALLSRIYLADGPLYGYEIERLGFRPRIVVLSACETAIQRRLAGDETFGLVRAFLSRGTETVIASLWKVADESTALLMGAFYRERAANAGDAAGALQRAQLELLASPRYAHPFYWAPYVAAGAATIGSSTPATEVER